MTSLTGSRDTTLSGNHGIVQFENLENVDQTPSVEQE